MSRDGEGHTSTEFDGSFEKEDSLLPMRWSSVRPSGEALFAAGFKLDFRLFDGSIISAWKTLWLCRFGDDFC